MVEKKNRFLEGMAKKMLIARDLFESFWVKAINTACYILNTCMIRSLLDKTLYKLPKERRSNLTDLRPLGCNCFIHNNKKNALKKFEQKVLKDFLEIFTRQGIQNLVLVCRRKHSCYI